MPSAPSLPSRLPREHASRGNYLSSAVPRQYFCEWNAAERLGCSSPMQERNEGGNLPQVFPKGAAIFITWNLPGSLALEFALDTRRTAGRTEDQKFARIDSKIDTAATGLTRLRKQEIAENVCKVIESRGEAPLLHCTLHESVVMPNYVHALFTPRLDVPPIMKGLKATTARFGNLALARTGNPFWQAGSYDHWCRNPVTAGLAAETGEWPWSSAHPRPANMRAAEGAQPLQV